MQIVYFHCFTDLLSGHIEAAIRCSALRAAPLYSRLGGPVRLLACTGQTRSRPVLNWRHCKPLALRGRADHFFSTHNRGCEVSRNPEDSGKDRSGCALPPGGSIQKNLSARCAGLRPQIFLLASLPFAVFWIGCVCIAVLNGSGSLELRRRRVKSANKL